MGRMLGVFDNDEELDRPDLNKCPDCGCFFADDACPLCGKTCPEEMRAGNRKAVKKKKHKAGPHYRPTRIDWYHRWWFIILMAIVSPFSIVGIILLLTSPRKTAVKVVAVVIMVVYVLASTFGLSGIVQSFINLFDEPVDRSLSQSEYIAACETVEAKEYFRASSTYEEKFVSVDLIVKDKIVDYDAYRNSGEYTTYYVCRDTSSRFILLVRDCRENTTPTLIAGDMITVYGEGSGEISIYDVDYELYEAPSIHMAFVALVG